MAKTLVMTALSPTMQDGVIAQWLVKEGQAVKAGDALCEIETDKATMPYESPSAGTILKITRPAGQRALVGETIAIIGKTGDDWQTLVSTEPPSAQAQPAQQLTGADFPALGPIVPLPERPSSLAAQPDTEATTSPWMPSAPSPSSPLARALARDHGIDLRSIRGSGPHGRIIARDVAGLASSESVSANPAALDTAAPLHNQEARSGSLLRDERVPLSKMRSVIAGRLGASYASAPHFFVRAAVDMERLLDLRASINAGRAHPIGLNAFVMRLVAAALERHPIVNASWEGDAIQYRPSADIGLAVSLDSGLITPVVRSCERKSVGSIDAELTDLVKRARAGTLAPHEYSEASFTISNLGTYGVEEFTAIINPPGSAILALGAISKEAVVRNDEIVARRTIRITLSSDHRVIDGAVAAAFVAELKALIENPALALV
jgi:pyruvate dehydrogenase E2 component (dihydrolipoamide acetyltransferase)